MHECLTYAHAEDFHAFDAGMPQLHGLSNESVKAQHQVLILCSGSGKCGVHWPQKW